MRAVTAALLLLALTAPLSARNIRRKKQLARSQFEIAERMREELNGRPAAERSKREYQRVTDAFRRVYYTAPTSKQADDAVLAVAELLAEAGRRFNDSKSLEAAVGQYEFLRREYPGSKHRFGALFTVGELYKDDLNDPAHAKATFEEFLKRYPHHHLAPQAKTAIAELEQPPEKKKKEPEAAHAERKSGSMPLVTGIRHWATPDYTRVAIDLETEVQYEAGRISNPDRIFFDLHNTKLASVLVGKSFEVEDGFLHKIRVAQYQRGMTRVVLEVDHVSEFSAFLLPNPYRLIVDIHGKHPQRTQIQAKKEPAKQEEAPAESKAVRTADGTTAPLKVDRGGTQPYSSSKETKLAASVRTGGPKPVEKSGSTASPGATHNPPPELADRKAARSELSSSQAKLQEGQDKKAERKAEDAASSTVAKLDPPEVKATAKPTSAPTFQSLEPRGKPPVARGKRKRAAAVTGHTARPDAHGERSLIRALGLKIGKIVVDAGHGGHDTGTIGPGGLQEKDLVLDVALRLGKLLETKMGADVVYTRDDDTFIPLETRTAIANQNEADLFISIHANSSEDPAARGIETYYLNFTSSPDALEVAARENAVSEKSIHELQDLVKKIALKEKIEESREFASDVQRSLYVGISRKNSAIRNRGVKKAPFIVLIGANMPSILAEISFLSNPIDERRLQTPEYRQKIAEYLYRGIARYVSGLSGVKVAKTSNAEPTAAR